MRYILISLVVTIFDQLTKHLVRTMIRPSEAINVLPFLQIVHIRNEGAAFGLFKAFGNITFVIISIVAIFLILYLLIRDKRNRISLSLILGGATGNLIDRIIYGNVTDFIDFYMGRFHWPAFNIADSALTVGISLMFIIQLREIIRGKASIQKSS